MTPDNERLATLEADVKHLEGRWTKQESWTQKLAIGGILLGISTIFQILMEVFNKG